MGVEEHRHRRNPIEQFDAPLTFSERIVQSVAGLRGGLIEPQRSTILTGKQINRFCGPCDFYKQDGTCWIELDSDVEQLRSVARQSCTFAYVDGQRGQMTDVGFKSKIIQLDNFIRRRS